MKHRRKQQQSYTVILSVCVILLISGCTGTLYKIEPENKKNTTDLVTVDVKPNSEDASNDKPTDVIDETLLTEERNDMESTATDASVEPSDTNENSDVENDLNSENNAEINQRVETLFVNQFSQDIDFDRLIPLEELDNTSISWSFKRTTDHSPVTAYNKFDIAQYGGYFIKPTDEKVVYLTFDEGYENGFTPTILDVLKENNVKAAFFITGDYIRRSPDLVQRMADEGHIIGNHSMRHPEFPTLNDTELFTEITELAEKYEALTGKKMDPFFRPPAGKYSEQVLYLTRKLGYRTIFWSLAYADWDTKNQPGKEVAYQHVIDNYHNGAIILLHAVSESNTQALDSIIKELIAQGYRFGSLYELE